MERGDVVAQPTRTATRTKLARREEFLEHCPLKRTCDALFLMQCLKTAPVPAPRCKSPRVHRLPLLPGGPHVGTEPKSKETRQPPETVARQGAAQPLHREEAAGIEPAAWHSQRGPGGVSAILEHLGLPTKNASLGKAEASSVLPSRHLTHRRSPRRPHRPLR